MNSQSKIENAFRKLVKCDKKVKNAYLLVHSEKLGVDLNIAEGKTGEIDANIMQASHMASVGKLFTATLIGILHDKGVLCYNEKISNYLDDDIKMGFPAIGFDYGYSVWKPKAIPVLMPKKYFCWGCVGVTGAFMFYHPDTESYVIGTFNDKSYTSKALRFMLTKVIKELINLNK